MIKIAVPGSLHTILISKETTWGTAVDPSKDVGIVTDWNDGTKRIVIPISGAGAIEVQKIVTASVSTAGSMTVQLQHGRLFEFLVGNVGHSTSGSDTRHTFSIIDTAPSFTMDSGEQATSQPSSAASEIRYEGCLAIAGELTFVLDDVLKLKMDWAGELPTSAAAVETPVIDNLIVFPQGLIDVKLNGVSATMVQNATIRFLKTFVAVNGAKSNLMQAAFTTDLKFEFNAVLGFKDKTLQELGIGGSAPPGTSDPTGIEFEIIADNGVAFGSGQRNIQCVLENCQFTNTEKIGNVGGVTFLNLAGTGTLKTLITVDDIPSGSF